MDGMRKLSISIYVRNTGALVDHIAFSCVLCTDYSFHICQVGGRNICRVQSGSHKCSEYWGQSGLCQHLTNHSILTILGMGGSRDVTWYVVLKTSAAHSQWITQEAGYRMLIHPVCT
jgi:hypothetical protein